MSAVLGVFELFWGCSSLFTILRSSASKALAVTFASLILQQHALLLMEPRSLLASSWINIVNECARRRLRDYQELLELAWPIASVLWSIKAAYSAPILRTMTASKRKRRENERERPACQWSKHSRAVMAIIMGCVKWFAKAIKLTTGTIDGSLLLPDIPPNLMLWILSAVVSDFCTIELLILAPEALAHKHGLAVVHLALTYDY